MSMQYRNARAIALGGVLAAAALAVALVMPAARLLSADDGLVQGIALFALPLFAVLAVTGIPFYGVARALSIALTLTVAVSVIAWLLALFAVAGALSGSATAMALTVAVFALPALVLIGAGLFAMRLFNGATPVEDREPSPSLTPPRSRLPHR